MALAVKAHAQLAVILTLGLSKGKDPAAASDAKRCLRYGFSFLNIGARNNERWHAT
jgi:hypothetical protein